MLKIASQKHCKWEVSISQNCLQDRSHCGGRNWRKLEENKAISIQSMCAEHCHTVGIHVQCQESEPVTEPTCHPSVPRRFLTCWILAVPEAFFCKFFNFYTKHVHIQKTFNGNMRVQIICCHHGNDANRRSISSSVVVDPRTQTVFGHTESLGWSSHLGADVCEVDRGGRVGSWSCINAKPLTQRSLFYS